MPRAQNCCHLERRVRQVSLWPSNMRGLWAGHSPANDHIVPEESKTERQSVHLPDVPVFLYSWGAKCAGA